MTTEKDKLLYRRQFILGPEHADKLTSWNKFKINDGLFLTVHPDLETTQMIQSGIQITLLGFIFDPFHPHRSNSEVLKSIIKSATCFDDVIKATEHCGGRWIIIWSDSVHVKMFHDACGLRQVFYTKQNGAIWCGSQPSVIVDAMDEKVETDEAAMQFAKSPEFNKTERTWPGHGTIYRSIKQLPPNHYLDVNEAKAIRYWPVKKLEKCDLASAVNVATKILQGSLKAAAHRYELMLAVTAGWDSRTLLAASKEIKQSVYYYVNKLSYLNSNSPDIKIPAQLLARLGIKFHVHDIKENPDTTFKQLLQRNVTMGRNNLPKSFTIYHHYKHSQNKLNVCGNGNEIARKIAFLEYGRPKKITAAYLARIHRYKNNEFAISMYQKWLEECESAARHTNIDILDLFYWEQRMGTWGAMYPAEQDIAIDEYCPFNNRRLLTTLLSVDSKYRTPPDYTLYRELIKNLWEDTLVEPINPLYWNYKVKISLQNLYLRYIY